MGRKISMIITIMLCLFLLSVILIAVGFAGDLKAKAVIKNLKDETIGTLDLEQTSKGVKITGELKDLPPGAHGFHIHEKGMVPPHFEEAGGHFNPFNKEHGMKNPKGMHAGDIQNIKVNKNGKVEVNVLAKLVTLEEGKPNSLLREGGTSIIIHEKADDYKTNPAGNSGMKIAGGAIEKSN